MLSVLQCLFFEIPFLTFQSYQVNTFPDISVNSSSKQQNPFCLHWRNADGQASGHKHRFWISKHHSGVSILKLSKLSSGALSSICESLVKSLSIQSIARALAVLASLGNLLETQNTGPALTQILYVYKIPRCFSGILKFQNHGGRHLV